MTVALTALALVFASSLSAEAAGGGLPDGRYKCQGLEDVAGVVIVFDDQHMYARERAERRDAHATQLYGVSTA